MTTFLVLAALLILVDLVAGTRMLLRDRSTAPPVSHPDWGGGGLPSTPYALRH